MKNSSLFSVAADSVLAAACALFITFTAVRYYTGLTAAALALGCAAGAALGAAQFMRLRKKRSCALAFGKKERARQAFKTYMCSLGERGAAQIIAAATGGKITPEGVVSDGKLYIAKFMPELLSPNDMCGAIAQDTPLEKVVVCNGATDEAVRFASTFGVRTELSDSLFERLENLSALPEGYLKYGRGREKFSQRFRKILKRAHAKRFMFCGLWLAAFSYFTFFPAYYIAAGGIMLIFAAACLLFGEK